MKAKYEKAVPYYEPHPVSPERKAELRSKGYRVLDAKFAPEGWVDPEAPKRKPRKVADDAHEDEL